ncbi:MAG: hypothetical protein ACYC91_01740 [Solirubrobacteraceae bacterium]
MFGRRENGRSVLGRRLIVALGGTLVLLAGLPAAESSAALAQPAVVCPLETAAVTTCCGPPVYSPDRVATSVCCAGAGAGQARCCGTGAACISPLTISSSADPSLAGRPVTVSGRLVGASSGTAITLWQLAPGQSGFAQVAHTTTDSTGGYSFRRSPDTTREFYVASSGMRSTTLRQYVEAVVSLRTSGRRARVGRKLTLTGTVFPEHRGGLVQLQLRGAHGAWLALASARLRLGSRFTITLVLRTAGGHQLRVLLPGNAQNQTSASVPVTVTVTR